jgi:hypothetical protein
MKWLQFILSHSIFIAICAAALCYQTSVLLQFEVSVWLYAFIFFSTICSYNFYWLLSGYGFAGKLFVPYLKLNYSNVIVFFSAAIGMVISLFNIVEFLPVICISFLLTLLYAVPLMPFKFLHFTRKAGLLKTLLLAFTWAFVTVYIPYQQAHRSNTLTLFVMFNNRFLFMLMLCIIFDARDTRVDKIRGLQSLTTLLKPSTVKLIMLLVFSVYMINGILLRAYYHETRQVLALLISGIVTAWVYYLSLKKQGYFFYYFGVDGLMLFSSLATYLAGI